MKQKRTGVDQMGSVEESVIVAASRRDLYHFADWCYNLPQWFPAIKKARILTLPDSNGLGKVTHYVGKMMGRKMEWEAESTEWKEDVSFTMNAFSGFPSKMNMQFNLLFEDAGEGRVRVTGILGFRAALPLIGRIIEFLFVRREAERMLQGAISGLARVAKESRIPSLREQFDRRAADHPGYDAGTLHQTG